MAFDWLKGHGTENDFVLLPDHHGTVHGDLGAEFVAALCHRRRGLGADGVLRVIRTAALGLKGPMWFMDYRNADGSISQMCGNGIRVFARHLVDDGLVDGPEFDLMTRDGIKHLTVDGDQVSVDMGRYLVGGTSKVEVGGREYEAREVHTGNPHAVAFVERLDEAGSLLTEPGFDHALYPDGVNIEFVVRDAPDHLSMRVHERGSGETRSCGTGACASAIAAAHVDGSTGRYRVDVPGGTLRIDVAESTTRLTGPAAIVARGRMEWFGE